MVGDGVYEIVDTMSGRVMLSKVISYQYRESVHVAKNVWRFWVFIYCFLEGMVVTFSGDVTYFLDDRNPGNINITLNYYCA